MSLSISALGGYDTFYPIYSAAPVNRVDAADRVGRDSRNIKTEPNDKVKKGECQTCAKRKYVDGSNEFNVSFKAPGHISPEDSAAKVMAHEQQHVANAIAEGSKPNKELISATGYRFTLPFVRNVAALMYPVETPILSFVQQAILPTLMQNCSSV